MLYSFSLKIILSILFFSSSFFYNKYFSESYVVKIFRSNFNNFQTIIKQASASNKLNFFSVPQKNKTFPINPVLSKPQQRPNASQFKVNAKSAAALDVESNTILFEFNSKSLMPMASITKLMTALVFLDYNPGWNQIYQIKKQDRVEGGKIYLFPGEKVFIKDLFNLSLVASANTATRALVSASSLSEKKFIIEMNKKAHFFGLDDTHFKDFTGLSNKNFSTAQDLLYLAKIAFSYQDIREATTKKEYKFKTMNGRLKIVHSTDKLLEKTPFKQNVFLLSGKTGYTQDAGYCFVAEFQNKSGHKIITVILGAANRNDRFQESQNLAQWIYSNYQWSVKK